MLYLGYQTGRTVISKSLLRTTRHLYSSEFIVVVKDTVFASGLSQICLPPTAALA
jgi:hypothetical protein